jgi:hypothetical protein
LALDGVVPGMSGETKTPPSDNQQNLRRVRIKG